MVKVLKFGLMVQSMKVNTKMELNTDMESSSGLMGALILVNFYRQIITAWETTNGPMGENTQVSGKTI